MDTSLPLNNAGSTLKGLATTLRVMGGTSGALYNIGLTAAAGGGSPVPPQTLKQCVSVAETILRCSLAMYQTMNASLTARASDCDCQKRDVAGR